MVMSALGNKYDGCIHGPLQAYCSCFDETIARMELQGFYDQRDSGQMAREKAAEAKKSPLATEPHLDMMTNLNPSNTSSSIHHDAR